MLKPGILHSHMLRISPAGLQEIESIRAFYNQCRYGGGLNEEDLIFTAQFEKSIVGVVRLCPSNGFFVLRGMQVLAPFQRQGIGTKLLQACADQLAEQVCYCIPWQHLKSFYQQIGFQETLSIGTPDLLCERFESYISKGMSVIIMRRLPAA